MPPWVDLTQRECFHQLRVIIHVENSSYSIESENVDNREKALGHKEVV